MVRQKNWITKGGLSREDSDDELGYDDHPWQWTYETDERLAAAEQEDTTTSNPRKRKADALYPADDASMAQARKPKQITGAEMGSFSVQIGDAVLLKSPEAGKDWAGLICAFSDTNEDGEDEMCAHIMWFCSREELEEATDSTRTRTTSRKIRSLPEAMMNESYITADFNMNPLTAINGKAVVVGHEEFTKLYPEGKIPKGKAAAAKFAKTIVCRRGVKQRNLRFTDEFEWKDFYKGSEDLLGLLDWVKEQTKGRKKQVDDGEYDRNGTREAEERDRLHDMIPMTPKKKRKTTTSSAASTPRSSVKSAKLMTPTSARRIVIKRPLEFTPLGTRMLSPTHFDAINTSPYKHARSTLHVSAVPTSLPCRTNEFSTVYQHLHSAITDGAGTCIYISGTPGTGKTATVREVVASLHRAVQDDELDDFNFVEINGMKVTEPTQSYSLLWEALKGVRVSPVNALRLLEHEFSHPSPRRIPCVVLMDELDQLVTKSQSVMYNFFNWPGLRYSRLIVLAVANTMDLPERTLSNKISSRLGLIRVTFSGYSHSQLMEIISSRLEGVGQQDGTGGIVEPDAVQFAARKVAAVSGDARRALDICRRAVEIAEQQALVVEAGADLDTDNDRDLEGPRTPSKSNRGKTRSIITNTTSQAVKTKTQPRVTIATIKQAINEATSSPIAQYLRSLPLSSKLFLAALLARSRRTGVSESTLGDVLLEAKRLADIAEHSAVHDFLLVEHSIHGGSGTGKEIGKGKGKEMPGVLAMGAAVVELVEAGVVAVDVRGRGERGGKVRLRIGEEEVKGSLMGDGEVGGMGFNG